MDWKTFLTGGSAGAFFGYLGTLLSDPIKNGINDWRKRRLLRRSLYDELAINYGWLTALLAPEKLTLLEPRFAENIKEHASLHVYEHALENKDLFLGLNERGMITEINTTLKKLLEMDSHLMPGYEFVPLAATQGKALIAMIEGAVNTKKLSIKLLRKVNSRIGKKLQDIKAGRIRRSFEIYEEIDKRATDQLLELMKIPPPPPIP